MNEAIINPEWEKAQLGIDFPDFTMICLGPPPNYLVDFTGQLEFPFVLDLIDFDE